MRTTVIFLLGSVLMKNARGQCGMTSTLLFTNNCSPLQSYVFSGVISGGVAPYSVQIQEGQTAPFSSWGANTAGTTWSISSPTGYGHPGYVHLTVTDNNGCIYSTTTSSAPVQYLQAPTYGLSFDCAVGWRLDWTGWNPQSGQAPCPVWNANTTYWLDGVSGTLASAWTQISASAWRYDLPVQPGNHVLYIINGTQCSGRQDCFASTAVSVPANTITPGDCGVNVSVRAALQGALPSGTLMTDGLRAGNLIPTVEPYSALGYAYAAYTGPTTISPSLLTVAGNDAIVDWVVVELRNSALPGQVTFSKPALLQRDGDVIDLDGDSYVNFPNAGGSYYIAIRHRDHLGIMTATMRTLGISPTTVDMRISSTSCYGSEAGIAVGSVQCLWAGDANGDGSIKYTGSGNDRDPIILAVGGTTPNNVVSNVYDRRDTNLDGVIKYTGTGNDRDIILTNVGSTTPNNTRTQQLP